MKVGDCIIEYIIITVLVCIIIFLLAKRYSYEKHLFLLIGVFAISILIPIIISRLFEVSESHVLVRTLFDQDEILSYYGSYLSFIGTVLLGAIAIWQNDKFKKESDRKDEFYMFIENEKLRLQYMPSFIAQSTNVDEWKNSIITGEQKIYIMKQNLTFAFIFNNNQWLPSNLEIAVPEGRISEVVKITNIGNNAAHQVKVYIDKNGTRVMADKAFSIKVDDSVFLFLDDGDLVKQDDNYKLIFRYFDSFQNIYEQSFDITYKEKYLELSSHGTVSLVMHSSQMNSIYEISK